jgi:hypothetical protein
LCDFADNEMMDDTEVIHAVTNAKQTEDKDSDDKKDLVHSL